MAFSYISLQSRLASGRKFRAFFVLLVCVAGLVACGKRPQHVDAPIGAEDKVFPRVYPDPSTDPKP